MVWGWVTLAIFETHGQILPLLQIAVLCRRSCRFTGMVLGIILDSWCVICEQIGMWANIWSMDLQPSCKGTPHVCATPYWLSCRHQMHFPVHYLYQQFVSPLHALPHITSRTCHLSSHTMAFLASWSSHSMSGQHTVESHIAYSILVRFQRFKE